MSRTDIKIFIASSGELKDERDESVLLIAELNKRYKDLHLEPVLFEFDTPAGNTQFKERIQDAINPKLEESHIAVILFYSKAGEFTLEELELAIKWNKKVFVYFKEGFATENLDELNRYGKVLELKNKMDKESKIRYQKYKTTTDFNGMLYKDLGKYLDETYAASAETTSETVSTSRQHIPLAPRPYLAHPYAIIKNFTGRREEMTRLTEWFKYEKEPMCVVEAIGGMGKSSVCWKWLQDEIISTNEKIDGIVWWSFYDQSFEDFIHHMYEYCIPENIRMQQKRVDKTTEVINTLVNHRFLIVLDGFERVLRGYAQMMSMYIQEDGLSQKMIEDINQKFDIHQRTPITPKAEKLLRAICTGSSKALMTTRLFPSSIEGLAGIKHMLLTGLSKTDTISFFKSEGIAGTDDEMIRAGEVYGFHPLMLKLLSTVIKRSFDPKIAKVFQEAFAKGLIDDEEPQKILLTSYQLLNEDEKKVASALSVLRTAFNFVAAKALFPDMPDEILEEVIRELCNLGFILYNEQQKLFDFHPILRSYLYDGLTMKDTMHQLAITYFSTQTPKEKIVTLADMELVIEQYHHLIRAARYDEAFRLYLELLHRPLLYQFAQYELCLNLCQQLFKNAQMALPELSDVGHQRFIVNELGITYSQNGQLNKSNENFLKSNKITYEVQDEKNLAIGLENISELICMPCGRFSQAIIQLKKSINLVKDIDTYEEAYSNSILGIISTYRVFYSSNNQIKISEKYLKKTMRYYTKNKNYFELACYSCLGYTNWALSQIQKNINEQIFLSQAIDWSLKTVDYAEQIRIVSNPSIVYFLFGYEAMSKSLIASMDFGKLLPFKENVVFFYDEHFQKITDKITLHSNNYSTIADRCVHEGLTLSRKINNVYKECTFLLFFAKLEWLKIKERQTTTSIFWGDLQKIISDTYILAERIQFRLLLADIHLFCAEVLLDLKGLVPNHKEKLLNSTAKEHLLETQQYARDASKIEDIFLPPDADEFYKDIPEYKMLKRGLTEKEKIKNGYYGAWLRAEELEKRS
ncbi:MAG: hypothetical protein QM737_21140 [Ferruginibacter sp.]